jgi:predicted DNA-binding protein
MEDVTVTVRMQKPLFDSLAALSIETQRSKSYIGMEAIQHYVELRKKFFER